MNWLTVAISGTLSAMLSSMGLGGGGVLIIYFSLFTNVPQLLAQGINLLVFIPVALIATIIYAHNKLINFKLVIIFSTLGLIGALIGSFLTFFISSKILSKIFAILLLIMGLIQLKNRS